MSQFDPNEKICFLEGTRRVFEDIPQYIALYYVRIIDAMYEQIFVKGMELDVVVSAVVEQDFAEESELLFSDLDLVRLLSNEFEIMKGGIEKEVNLILGHGAEEFKRPFEVGGRSKGMVRARQFSKFIRTDESFPNSSFDDLLLQYKDTFKNFLRICVAAGFPVADEYRDTFPKDCLYSDRKLREVARADNWPLTDAIELLFGKIGQYPRWEHQVENAFIRPTPPHMDEDALDELSGRDREIAQTMEYRMAREAIGSKKITACFSALDPREILVEPKSFVYWVRGLRFPIPGFFEAAFDTDDPATSASEPDSEIDAPINQSLKDSGTANEDENSIERSGKSLIIRYKDVTYTAEFTVGLEYIVKLIHLQGRKISSSDLVAQRHRPGSEGRKVGGFSTDSRSHLEDDDPVSEGGGALELGARNDKLVDDKYLADATIRRTELKQELEDAKRNNQIDLIAGKTMEIQIIESEVLAYTKPERNYLRADEDEKNRKSVAKAIKTARNNMQHECPELFKHLDCSISLGASCIYAPEVDPKWAVLI